MKTYAMTLNLKDDPELIRQYRYHHANPYPEVVEAFRTVGVLDMKIFLLGRRLFLTMDTIDTFEPAVDFPRYLTLHPRCQEWEDMMGDFQERLPESKEGEKWVYMEQIFQL
jgi:L-rhamnose mutarotase